MLREYTLDTCAGLLILLTEEVLREYTLDACGGALKPSAARSAAMRAARAEGGVRAWWSSSEKGESEEEKEELVKDDDMGREYTLDVRPGMRGCISGSLVDDGVEISY